MDERLTADEVREALKGATARVTVTVATGGDRPELERRLNEVAGLLAHARPETVVVEEGALDDDGPLPCLTLSSGEKRIHYSVVPEGPEAAPFLEALAALGGAGEESEVSWRESVADLGRPAELLVLVAPGCPHCPHAVRAATRLAAACDRVTTVVVDGFAFPELMERYKVRSVPVTIVDRELTVVGVVPPEKLVERILARGGAGYELERFRSWIEAGRLDEAAAEVVRGRGARFFLEAWKGSNTSDRMGLLLVAEQALGSAPRSLDGIVPGLLEALGAADAALRGDTADLLGQIGHPSAREALTAALGDANPDVAEIAQEALDSLRG